MKLQEVIRAQIDSAIVGLTRIRDDLSSAENKNEIGKIEQNLEWVTSHLEDIRHNWMTFKPRNVPASSSIRPTYPLAALLCDRGLLHENANKNK